MFNVITLVNFLHDAGHVVDVVCIEEVSKPVAGIRDGITVTGLNVCKKGGFWKLICRLAGGLRLRRYLRGRSFDVLYVIDSWTLPCMWLATLGTLRWRNANLVYHTFDWLEPGLVSIAHRRLEQRMCRLADLVVNTDRARARLQKTLYDLKTVPLWVQNSLSRDLHIPEANESLRRELAGCEDASMLRIVLYPTIVSNRESSQRMTWELIQAFRHLPDHYRLILFFREGEEYRRCLAACAAAGVEERVKFIEPVPFLQLLNYVASSDIGAVFYDDSLSSGYFMCNADKLFLMAACGIPFVASDQPNLESITYRYGLGKCCDPHDPIELANSFMAVAEGATPLAEWKTRARAAFLECLSFEIFGAKLLTAIDQLN